MWQFLPRLKPVGLLAINKMTTSKLPYSPNSLADYIHKCRTVEGGVPHFIPSYGGAYLTEDLNVFDVLAICWSGKPESPVGSLMFTNVPHGLVDEIKQRKRDYVWLIKEFGTKAQINESLSAPIIRGGDK